MLGPLPEFVDPFRLARQQARLDGCVPISNLARVAASVRDDSGMVEVELRFRMSASGVPRVDGGLRLKVRLTCQRCLEPIELELAPVLRIAFTDGGGASERAELAAGYEPLESVGRIGLTTIVEDEILLALPNFPMHLPEDCAAGAEEGSGDPDDSPFSGLRAQLQQFRI